MLSEGYEFSCPFLIYAGLKALRAFNAKEIAAWADIIRLIIMYNFRNNGTGNPSPTVLPQNHTAKFRGVEGAAPYKRCRYSADPLAPL